ncbi:unnamed protein product [Phaeothamnion confervicola]
MEDRALMELLAKVPEDQALASLGKYRTAMNNRGPESIKNKQGYLISFLKQYQDTSATSALALAAAAHAAATAAAAAGGGMTNDAKAAAAGGGGAAASNGHAVGSGAHNGGSSHGGTSGTHHRKTGSGGGGGGGGGGGAGTAAANASGRGPWRPISVLRPAVRMQLEKVFDPVKDRVVLEDVGLMKQLARLEEGRALTAIQNYKEQAAKDRGGHEIKNKSAYLMGILRGFIEGTTPISRSGGGSGGEDGGGSDGGGGEANDESAPAGDKPALATSDCCVGGAGASSGKGKGTHAEKPGLSRSGGKAVAAAGSTAAPPNQPTNAGTASGEANAPASNGGASNGAMMNGRCGSSGGGRSGAGTGSSAANGADSSAGMDVHFAPAVSGSSATAAATTPPPLLRPHAPPAMAAASALSTFGGWSPFQAPASVGAGAVGAASAAAPHSPLDVLGNGFAGGIGSGGGVASATPPPGDDALGPFHLEHIGFESGSGAGRQSPMMPEYAAAVATTTAAPTPVRLSPVESLFGSNGFSKGSGGGGDGGGSGGGSGMVGPGLLGGDIVLSPPMASPSPLPPLSSFGLAPGAATCGAPSSLLGGGGGMASAGAVGSPPSPNDPASISLLAAATGLPGIEALGQAAMAAPPRAQSEYGCSPGLFAMAPVATAMGMDGSGGGENGSLGGVGGGGGAAGGGGCLVLPEESMLQLLQRMSLQRYQGVMEAIPLCFAHSLFRAPSYGPAAGRRGGHGGAAPHERRGPGAARHPQRPAR